MAMPVRMGSAGVWWNNKMEYSRPSVLVFQNSVTNMIEYGT